MFRGWTCDTWLGKPLGGTLGKWIMVVIFQIGHSHNTRFRKSYKINWNHLKLNHEVNNVSKLLKCGKSAIACVFPFRNITCV